MQGLAAVVDILYPKDFKASPWKNGCGITHEVARDVIGADFHWRISIADVRSDGPFSFFPEMERILTVIEGAGINLIMSDTVLEARLESPVFFKGELEVTGQLIGGPIRDLNLIYDPKFIEAKVEVIVGCAVLSVAASMVGFLCLSGNVTVDSNELPVGAFALGGCLEVVLLPGATGVMVTLIDLV
jgi:uncharacterized protein